MAVEEWGNEYIWGFNEQKNKPEIIKIEKDENIRIDIRDVFRKSATYRKVNEKKIGAPKRRKRDSYEHIPLLSIPSNYIRHHITDKYIVPIPKEAHNTGLIFQTNIHRRLVEEWMKENNKVLYNITQFIKETPAI